MERCLGLWVFSFLHAFQPVLSGHSLSLPFVGYDAIGRYGVILARRILSGESASWDGVFNGCIRVSVTVPMELDHSISTSYL